MRLSIITPVLNSHEIVRRQILRYERMQLPDDIEILIIDDGSDPALGFECSANISIHHTWNKKPWTEHIARNKGAGLAQGEYLLLIDIDYIIPKKTIEIVRGFNGDRMDFRRRFGILDEHGIINCDDKTLKAYGLKDRWIRKIYAPGHRSQFCIRKDLFWHLGGYNEALDGQWRRTGGAGEKFWRKWQREEMAGNVVTSEQRPTVFMFPVGKFCENENTIFHNLSKSNA